MKCKSSLVLSSVLLITAGAAALTGCVAPQAKVAAAPPSAEVLILGEGNTLRDTERMISSVHSEHVVLSTEALRELFRREHAKAQRCEALGEQLRALKNIDVQEIQ